MKPFFIHPYIKIVLLLIAIAISFKGTLNHVLIFYGYLFLLSAGTGNILTHLKFLAFGMLPVYVSYLLLYRVIPEHPLSWEDIHFRISRILLITSAVQLSLSVSFGELADTLRLLGIRGNGQLVILSSYSLVGDIQKKSEKIIEARYAAGYIHKRTYWNKVRQFPYILVPLFVQLFQSALERGISWNEKNIVLLLDSYPKTTGYHPVANMAVLLLALVPNALVFIFRVY